MTETTESKPGLNDSAFARQWHYRPPVPIEVSPFFSWPPDPARMVRWVADRWFSIAENTILVVLAYVTWRWFQPDPEQAKTLAPATAHSSTRLRT